MLPGIWNHCIKTLKNIFSTGSQKLIFSCTCLIALRPIIFLDDTELALWGNVVVQKLSIFYGSEQCHLYKDPDTNEMVTVTSEAMVNTEATMVQYLKIKKLVLSQFKLIMLHINTNLSQSFFFFVFCLVFVFLFFFLDRMDDSETSGQSTTTSSILNGLTMESYMSVSLWRVSKHAKAGWISTLSSYPYCWLREVI